MRKHNLRNVICLLVMTSMVMTACGKENADEQETVSPEVQETEVQETEVQETEVQETEVQEPIEEEPNLDATKMSIDKWVDTIQLMVPTFIIYDTETREKLSLEEGQEYQVVEGKILVEYVPKEYDIEDSWMNLEFVCSEHYDNFILRYYSFGGMSDKVEAKKIYTDSNGEERTITCTFYKPVE